MNDTDKNINTNIEHIKKIYFWRSAFFGLIILVAGIVIGSASMSILTTHKMTTTSPSGQFDIMPRMNRILGLTQQQINKIGPILDGHMQHLYDLRENARSDIINTLDSMNNEISPILGKRQKIVWQQELVRIQRELNPEIPRTGGGQFRRRGAEPENPIGRRYGRGQQQRIGDITPRPSERQFAPTGPNTPVNDINESKEKQ